MNISIGGVVLCPTLLWNSPYGVANQAYSSRTTLLGKVVIQHSPSPKRVISLETVSTTSGSIVYFTKDQLDQIEVLKDAMNSVVFIYGSETLDVIIAPDGINVSQVGIRNNPDSTDYYEGSIQLIEV